MSTTGIRNLFTFSGRIGRGSYWIRLCGSYFCFIAILLLSVEIHNSSASDGLVFITLFVATWISIAAAVKRTHDRGRPWYILLFFAIPVLDLWPFIELGFLPGEKDSYIHLLYSGQFDDPAEEAGS
jgi:uncharacterized membrane protein YhaH (DUF805 family)